MPNVIKPKRSAVAGNIPTTSQIGQYEIAMNTADKKIFTSNGTNIIQIAAGELSGLGDVQLTTPSNGQSLSYNSTTGKWVNSNAGAGDVVGPSSSTDNSVVRFDGTTGKLIQGSPVAISDTGAISGAESISNIDFAQFDTTVTVTEGVGKLQWDDGNGTLQFGLKGGNVNLQVGQEVVARVYNDSGVALTDGQIVYISGSQGNRIAVKLAKADSETTSAGTLGMVTESIAIGAEGFITMVGTVNKLNTSGLTAGALVYLSATTAGAYTTTPPTAPNHRVTLGYVERVDNNVGSIYVKVDNGYELDELHNVVITSPTSGQTLIYDAVAGTWENASLSNGTGISVTNGAGTITIANTGVTSIAGTANQIVASAATGGITLSLPSLINVNTSGSAASLTTARTINGTSFNGTANITTNSWGTARTLTIGSSGKSVDGSAAVSWTLAEIGAQPADADLTAIAGLAGTSGFLKKTAADTWSLDTNTYYLASNPNGYTTNTGTVTSVSATAGTGISITGSPITTSGTLTITNTAPNVTTDISITHNASTVVVNSSDGTDGTINAATTTLAGVMSSTDKTKLDGIATGANNYTLPAATSTALGGIELFSDTVQSVAANAVSATDSRTYGVQVNSSGQAVVNVPWTDTNSGGTVTSVSGTGSYGGLTLSGTVTGSGSLTLGGTPTGTWPISVSGNSATTSQRTFDRVRTDNINRGSYGSISVSGTNNTYHGIDFTDNSHTWMGSVSDGVSFGVYKNNSSWAFYFDNDGTLQVGTIPWARVSGAPTSYPANGGTSSAVTINYNNDSNSTYQMLWGSGNSVYGTGGIYCNPATDYLYASSFYCSNWFRSSGSTGWYNESYAVGIYATEAGNVRTYNGANFIAAGNVTAYSDERLKENWRDLPLDFVEKLSKIKHGIYDRTDTEFAKTQVGVSAQSLEKILPNAIIKDSEGYLSVNYGSAAMVSAVKLAEKVIEQEKRIEQLESLVNQLMQKLA